MVPWKSVGSCGMMPKRERRSCNPIVVISTESIIILPPAGSTRRNNAPIKVVFPLPVRPTMPILSPPSNVQVIPCKTRGASCLYLICRMKIIHVNLLETITHKVLRYMGHTYKYLSFCYLQISKLHPASLGPVWWWPIFFNSLCRFTWYIHVLVHPFHRDDLICKLALILDGENKGHI